MQANDADRYFHALHRVIRTELNGPTRHDAFLLFINSAACGFALVHDLL